MSLALASMLVASGVASAQEMADTTKVNVAFGQVSKADLMGGVSEVNVEELLKRTTAPMHSMIFSRSSVVITEMFGDKVHLFS